MAKIRFVKINDKYHPAFIDFARVAYLEYGDNWVHLHFSGVEDDSLYFNASTLSTPEDVEHVKRLWQEYMDQETGDRE